MAIKLLKFENREQWLKARSEHGIGGSDAACIVGANPWRTNRDLWEIMTGRQDPRDISDKAAVKYGSQAEEYLRELFRLDYPDMAVGYDGDAMIVNDELPSTHASLDGTLIDEQGRVGILEIKTTTIQGAGQKLKWEGKIPENYYVQVLHYLLVTGWDFTILRALLRYEIPGKEFFAQIRDYRIERADVLEDIKFLAEAESEFLQHVKDDTPPALVLPEI